MLRLNPNSQIDNGGNCDHQMLDSNMDNISMDALLGHNQGSRKREREITSAFSEFQIWRFALRSAYSWYIYILFIYCIYINNIYIWLDGSQLEPERVVYLFTNVLVVGGLHLLWCTILAQVGFHALCFILFYAWSCVFQACFHRSFINYMGFQEPFFSVFSCHIYFPHFSLHYRPIPGVHVAASGGGPNSFSFCVCRSISLRCRDQNCDFRIPVRPTTWLLALGTSHTDNFELGSVSF